MKLFSGNKKEGGDKDQKLKISIPYYDVSCIKSFNINPFMNPKGGESVEIPNT
jgi:hypothetical protein